MHIFLQLEEIFAIIVLHLLNDRDRIAASDEYLVHFQFRDVVDFNVVWCASLLKECELFNQVPFMIENEHAWCRSVSARNDQQLLSDMNFRVNTIEILVRESCYVVLDRELIVHILLNFVHNLD